MNRFCTALFLILFVGSPAFAQVAMFDLPRVSPAAKTAQRIGITDITVEYHRPGMKGRDIWGALVPYGRVWRAGANENTVLTITTPVTVNGVEIPAGSYGLHIIPDAKEWTFAISRQSQAWGSFSYDPSEDVVRVKAKPTSAPEGMSERLQYTFENITTESADLTLRWAGVAAGFTIAVDVNTTVATYLRGSLRGLPRFYASGWQQAAEWCLNNDTNTDEAMVWIDRSLAITRQFSNLQVKAGLLEKQGKQKEADRFMTEAMTFATEGELNRYGYSLLGRGEHDRAIEVFKKNVRDHPNSWNVNDSLADAYASKGDNKNAIKYYTRALNLVDDETQKARIESTVATLKNAGS